MGDELSKDCKKASDLIDEIYNNWEFASYDEETETEYRKPMSKSTMDKSQELLNQIRKIDCEEEWVNNKAKEYQDVVDYQNKRVFKGKTLFPFFIIIYAIIGYLLPGIYYLSPEKAELKFKSSNEKQIKKYHNFIINSESSIRKIERRYNKYKSMTEAERDEKIALRKKHIEKYKKKIEDLNVATFSQSKNVLTLFVNIIVGIILLFSGLFFKKALSPPNFLRDKRSKEKESKSEKARSIFSAIIDSLIYKLMNSIATQDATFDMKTTYSDGSSITESFVNPILLIKAAVMLGVIITINVYAALVAPFFLGYNYMKNYVWYR